MPSGRRRLFALTEVASAVGLTAGISARRSRRCRPRAYLTSSYYERWLFGLECRLQRAGTIAPQDVEDAMARLGDDLPQRRDPALAAGCLAERPSGDPLPPAADPRFGPGERVRVRRMRPTGHTRCPRYVRGAIGVVARVHGDDLLPDAVARGERGSARGGLCRAVQLRRSVRHGGRAPVPGLRRPLGVVSRGARMTAGESASDMHIMRLGGNLLGFYDGRGPAAASAPIDNWVDDGALSLGICSFAIVDGRRGDHLRHPRVDRTRAPDPRGGRATRRSQHSRRPQPLAPRPYRGHRGLRRLRDHRQRARRPRCWPSTAARSRPERMRARRRSPL